MSRRFFSIVAALSKRHAHFEVVPQSEASGLLMLFARLRGANHPQNQTDETKKKTPVRCDQSPRRR